MAVDILHAGQYVADVAVDSGTVTVGGGNAAGRQTVVSRGQFPLGTLSRGKEVISIDALDGPQARWSVTVRPLPVAVTGPTWSVRHSRPGTIVTASYRVSGDARVTARVLDRLGKEVRVLARDLAVTAGDRTLTWDGLTLDGKPVTDNDYLLEMTIGDATGLQPPRTAVLTVDGARPVIKRMSPRRIPRFRGLVMSVRDRTSGVRSAVLRLNGRTVKRLVPMSNRVVYRPKRGWRRGRHYRYEVVAFDRAGNRAVSRGRLTPR